MRGLEGRSIFITGAARGIGAAMAAGLAAGGARVAIADLRAEDAEAMARKIGGRAIGLAADVRERASMRRAIGATVERFGDLDAIFNNAGIAQVKPGLPQDWGA